jgi:hypothetical protein
MVVPSGHSHVGHPAGAVEAPPRQGQSVGTGRRLLGPSLLALSAAVLVGLLMKYDPHRGLPFLPSCPVSALTGIECPGCGGLRASWSLLHGDIAGAWESNPLVFAIIPALAVGLVLWLKAAVSNTAVPRLPRPVAWGILALSAVWMLARNAWA